MRTIHIPLDLDIVRQIFEKRHASVQGHAVLTGSYTERYPHKGLSHELGMFFVYDPDGTVSEELIYNGEHHTNPMPFQPHRLTENHVRIQLQPYYAMEVVCRECGKVYDYFEVKRISNLNKVVLPGDIVPAGICPECMNLCYFSKGATAILRAWRSNNANN